MDACIDEFCSNFSVGFIGNGKVLAGHLHWMGCNDFDEEKGMSAKA